MTTLAFALLVFLVLGSFFLFVHLLMGKFLRPAKPDAEKLSIYECGEPTVGSAWVQFDARYYVVALLFVIFDVEVAFFFPWAVVFGTANQYAATADTKLEAKLLPAETLPKVETGNRKLTPESAKSWARIAFVDILVFFSVLMVGFAYLWRRGDIDWIKSVHDDSAVSA